MGAKTSVQLQNQDLNAPQLAASTLSATSPIPFLARTRVTGGLSNRLFQLACLQAYCERSGKHTPVVYDTDIESNPHGSADACFSMFPRVQRLRGKRGGRSVRETVFGEQSPFAFEPLALVDTDVCINGNRQSVGYFGSAATCVPALEAPRKPRYRLPATAFPDVDFARTVFIHVRRGDFVGTALLSDLRLYFEACLREVLVLAPRAAALPHDAAIPADVMRTPREQQWAHAPPTHVLLISNDQAWARALVGDIMASCNCAATTRLVPEPRPQLMDAEAIMAMAACAGGGICSNSTLSWWGAFMCFVRNGSRSYFPFPWMTSARMRGYRADYPDWTRLVGVFTGTRLPAAAAPRTEWLLSLHCTTPNMAANASDASTDAPASSQFGIAAHCDAVVNGTSILSRTARYPRTLCIVWLQPEHVQTARSLLAHTQMPICIICTAAAHRVLQAHGVPAAAIAAGHTYSVEAAAFDTATGYTLTTGALQLPRGLAMHANARVEPVGVHSVYAIARRARAVILSHPTEPSSDARIRDWCRHSWAPFADWQSAIIPERAVDALKAYRFCVCVSTDSSSQLPFGVWEALLAGCIPIIAQPHATMSTHVTPYAALPCVILQREWAAESLSTCLLESWWAALRPFFEDASARQIVLERLSHSFWWNHVTKQTRISSLQPIAIFVG